MEPNINEQHARCLPDCMNPDAFAAAVNRLRERLPVSDAHPLLDRLLQEAAGVEDWISAGESLLRMDPSAAVELLELGSRRLPDAAPLHYLLGNALRMSGQPGAAEASLRKAIALDPAHANASISLAHLLREQGRMRALAEVMLALWKHEPRSADSDRRTLSFLVECERYLEAESLLEPILEAHPAHAGLLRMAGEIALVLGRFEVAREQLRASLALDPGQASAWLRLAHTHRFSDDTDEDLALLQSAVARGDLGIEVEVSAGFALGKAFDDLGRFAEAAEVLGRANARWHAGHPWDVQAWRRFVDDRQRASTLPTASYEHETTPVFIVGLPRSGTTLAATRLARHPQVRGRGELNWIAAIARRLGELPSAAMLAAAGRFYLAQLRQDDAPARFHIDKNPLNFRHLDLIAAMLPQSKIIHCQRDLRDNTLSLWSQHFAHADMAWSYAFDDIAAYVDGYRALMQHWKGKLQLPVFELDYEALVTQTDATLGRLEAFLGLEATPASARVDATEAVATASVWQARQSVHRRSVGRWQHYLDAVPELGRVDAG